MLEDGSEIELYQYVFQINHEPNFPQVGATKMHLFVQSRLTFTRVTMLGNF